MTLDADQCYQALVAHDPRFDGAFYVGVSTTGIYCRTVCPARTPGRDRCTFFRYAAEAEHAGYRPCLRCRPELAPGKAHIDAVGKLAAVAFNRIEDGALTEGSLDDLAGELGVSARQLRRAVTTEFGVSPIELAQTQRLLTAKRLLTDTDMPVGEVAFASGFASLRRFNDLFQTRYGLNPTALRRSRPATRAADRLICETAYRDPFEWTCLLRFLARRAVKGVELVEDGAYQRTLAIGAHRGDLRVRCDPDRRLLRIDLSPSLAPVLPKALARVKRLFDVAADPAVVTAALGSIAEQRPGLRVPGACDGFEVAIRGILGQQVSVVGATTIAGRLVAKFGNPIDTGHPELTHTFPTAAVLAAADVGDIASLGMPGARSATVSGLANAVAHQGLALRPGVDVDQTIRRLKEIPGVGEWTAQYIAMRALSWPDAFPHSDLGIRKALGKTKDADVLAAAEPWRPWRAYAAIHLWQSLEAQQ